MNSLASPAFALWIAVARMWSGSVSVSTLLPVSSFLQLARKAVTLSLSSQLLSSSVASCVIRALSLPFIFDLEVGLKRPSCLVGAKETLPDKAWCFKANSSFDRHVGRPLLYCFDSIGSFVQSHCAGSIVRVALCRWLCRISPIV